MLSHPLCKVRTMDGAPKVFVNTRVENALSIAFTLPLASALQWRLEEIRPPMPRNPTSNFPYRQRPTRRRVSHRATPAHGLARRKRLSWGVRLYLTGVGSVLLLLGWGILARQLAPLSNTDLARFDAIIVLGMPADSDGNPTPV